jgi:putative transposase
MCFQAKNLYNTTNFYFRQAFTGLQKETKERHENEQTIIEEINKTIPKLNMLKSNYVDKRRQTELSKTVGKRKEVKDAKLYSPLTAENNFVSYELLDGIFKINKQSDYLSLPAHSNQYTIKSVFQDWKSFFESLKDYKKNPLKYKGRPKPPRYAKKSGRKVAYLSNQTCTIQKEKYLKLPKTKEKLNIGKLGKTEGQLKQVRIVPGPTYYTIELVFEKETPPQLISETPIRIYGIDLGVNNFATIVNNVGEDPIIVNGKAVKSINQYYNKMRAHYYSILRQGKPEKEGLFTSNKLKSLDVKRNDKIKDFLHKASFNIVKEAMKYEIDTIIIGKNEGFKEDVKLHKKDKQTFINIPYAQFVKYLTYKANEQGINVLVTEESYTSKASFLDSDQLPCYGEKVNIEFSGKRIKRGMYRAKSGNMINADCNGAANIVRKVVPDAFSKGNRGVVSTPVVLSVA